MKKPFFLISILILHYTLNGCNENEGTQETEQTIELITTDLSVSTSQSLISWIDNNDLTQKLESALSYNYGNALESEVEKKLSFTIDSTQVNTTIDFKAAYKSTYNDPNTSNNSVTIELEKEAAVAVNQGVELNADGPGNTYELITSILAPGQNPIEVPDCNHTEFGRHIDEIFDDELNSNVFQFYMHTAIDNDRCIKFDRQRNEIKSYSPSPDNLLGIENEKVVYKWKFKLPSGFQSSPNFTHLHQLKSVGGSLESIPIYTLTTRKGTPDKLELRYAETDDQVTLKKIDLDPLLDTWLAVTETITYSTSGTYEIEIKKVSDNTVLFTYSNSSIINWRPGADFVRPKWGIYRSLSNAQDLRDEKVLFADFSIVEIE